MGIFRLRVLQEALLSSFFGVLIMSRVVPISEVAPEQYQWAIEQAMLNDSRLFLYSFVSGSFWSIFGGYLAARIAKRSELLNGALASCLCVGTGLYSLGAGHSAFPLWLQLLPLVTSPALALFGGYLCRRGQGSNGT